MGVFGRPTPGRYLRQRNQSDRKAFRGRDRMQPAYQSKIVDLEGLVAAVDSARRAGRTIVQCHGCFDIVHPGHVRYLEFARRQGDVLIVTLTGDSSFSKREEGPYIPQELRAESLAALVFVDYVYIDPNPTAEQILAQVRPDLYVKGREYENSEDPGFLSEKRTVEDYGGRIVFSSGEIVFSSSQLIERMPAGTELERERLSLLCQRSGLSTHALQSLLGRFAGLRVLVVGDVVVDRYVLCDALGRGARVAHALAGAGGRKCVSRRGGHRGTPCGCIGGSRFSAERGR